MFPTFLHKFPTTFLWNILVLPLFMKVTIYSTTTCPYCLLLKNFLKEKNISYIEKMIDQDDAAKAEMSKDSEGFMGVPFTVVFKDDGTKETIVGFDLGKLNHILNFQ